jgi:hypothetical protein
MINTIISALVAEVFTAVTANHQCHQFIGQYLTGMAIITSIRSKIRDQFSSTKTIIILGIIRFAPIAKDRWC